MTLKLFVAAGLLAGAAGTATAAPTELRGLDAVDGNTVVVQGADGQPQRLRLAGIEAPLICQPGGTEARDTLREWVKGQLVTVSGTPKAAKVVLEGRELSRRMVEDGHAWSTRTKWDRGPFVKEERVALALKRGMHEMGTAVRPDEWRRTHAPCPASK